MNNSPRPVLVSSIGPVTTLTLNRPEKRNALNIGLLENLGRAIEHAEKDAGQRVIVLRGAGPVFCSGLDLEEMARPDTAHRSAEMVEATLRQIATTRLMTIAAVHGAAVAGGAGLMSACDFAVVTHDAKIGYPEVRRGLVPALIMTFLRRQLHERDARELLLLGRLVDADHARAVGLVNRVVAGEPELATEVQSLISALLQGAPEALSQTKKALADLWPSPYEQDFDRARSIHVAARTSREAVEGVAAFNEKRAPDWAP